MLDAAFAKSIMTSACGCMIESGKESFCAEQPSISIRNNQHNSRIVRAIRSWPETGMWEITPERSASVYECFSSWTYNAQTAKLAPT